MAKAIYITSSVGLYVCVFVKWRKPFMLVRSVCVSICLSVCAFVCLVVRHVLAKVFPMPFSHFKAISHHSPWNDYVWQDNFEQCNFQGQGQRSRSLRSKSWNHENQFFSKTKNIVFFKLWQMLVLGGVQKRLDFEKNRSRHSGSRSGQRLTFKMTITKTSTYHIV